MADPKYANLPGIAYDQQDIYETSDLPEADQANVDIKEENESIERVQLNASEAYEKFKGTSIDSTRVDFSDRIGQRQRIGYDICSGEYEMVGEGTKEPETLQQKYQRLQHEVRELMEGVETIKAEAKTDSKEKQNVMGLAKQAEDLSNQLQSLKLEQVLGAEILKNLSDPQGSLQKKLMAELDSFKHGQKPGDAAAKTAKAKNKPSADGGSVDQVVYELHYRPEVAKFSHNAKVADLEQRLQKMETVLGNDADKMASLASDTNHKSVLGAISVLNSKLNLLDPIHIDQADAHLAALSLRLTELADKRSVVEDAEKLNKVSELYELLKKTEALCTELPDIVDRMVILKDLHEQAMQFSTALSQLDATQQQINAGLKRNQDALVGVQQEFSKNANVIQANIKSLDARISALKK